MPNVIVRRLVLLAGAVACTAPELPAPEVLAVQPARVWRGADVPIVIEGRNFYPQIEVDARGFGTDYDREWTAFLVGETGKRTSLEGVSLESDTMLRAIVGAGLPAGPYTIEVAPPTEEPLPSTVRMDVSESQEAAFSVSYYDPPAAYVAGQQVRFLIEAVGLDSERVFSDVPITVTLSGAATAFASVVAFDDVAFIPDTQGFTATLPSGSAVLNVDLLAPGRLDVLAQSGPGAEALQPSQLTLVVGGGDTLPATIDLPASVLTGGVTAGERFDATVTVFDEVGNIVEEPLELQLVNACGGFDADLVVRGPTVVPVTVTRATSTTGDCVEEAIRVASGAVGSSASFRVRGGEATGFELFTLGFELEAGREDLVAVVRPRDAFDNTTSWSGTLSVTDDLDTLSQTSCQAAPQVLFCSATPTLAGQDITLTVTGDDGLVGALAGFSVRPSPVAAALSVSAPATVRAGEPFDVEVRWLDAFGNEQLAEQVDTTGVVLSAPTGDADCVLGTIAADGHVPAVCTLTVARPNATLTAVGSGPTAGLTGQATLAVDNGALASIALTTPASVVAGAPFALRLVAADAFGNPYVVQDDPTLDLSDGSETLTPTSAVLDANGVVEVTGATIPRAGTWRITAAQLGGLLGTSAPIAVAPGPSDALSVRIGAPWGRVGEATPVTVEAIDAFGNRTAATETVTVSSVLTSTPPEALAMVNGIVALDWVWDDVAIDEVLMAVSGTGLTGESKETYVVQDCADGPLTDLQFGGGAEAIACLDPVSSTALVVADFSGTVSGGAPVVGYVLAAESSSFSASAAGSSPAPSLSLPHVGSYAVAGLAVQSDGCAQAVETAAWIGVDDGSPSGPVALQLSAADLATIDSAQLDVVGVRDCAGDPAAGVAILVRTSAGEVVDGVPGGDGLELALDAAGDGRSEIATFGDVSAGVGRITAWTVSGSAGGELEVPIVGDGIRPTVRAQTPAGDTATLVDTVELQMSEPMLLGPVVPGSFALNGPGSSAIIGATLSSDGTRITLTIAPPADGGAGAWFLTATDALRDEAGNRLAGTWSGSRADYIGAFGDVGSGIAPLTCPQVVPASGRFRPDGDDGVDEQADTVEVALDAASVPAWWVAEVRDAGGGLVAQSWTVPVGPQDVWVWDGRDAAGFVLESGVYSVEIRPDDGVGNRGVGCNLTLQIDNPPGRAPTGVLP